MTGSVSSFPSRSPDDPSTSSMERVRDLLFGEAKREFDNRLLELSNSIDATNARFSAQLRSLEAKVDALSAALAATRQRDWRDLGEALSSMGRQIAALGDAGERNADQEG